VTFSGAGTITTGGTATAPPPTITAVQDAGSYTASVPQGGIFVVKGTNMSASGLNQPPLPYPTSAGGTSITFTPIAPTTGAPTEAYIVYTYNESGVNQLAGIVPSTLSAANGGTYNVTVTYNGTTSTPFATQVVPSKPGLFTQDQTGGGLAVVQNIVSATEYDLNRLTTGTVSGVTISPAKPGQTLIAYATGLGPLPFADNIVPPSTYSYPNVQVIVGGTSITPLYAGVSGYPGEAQINFTLPASVTTGCAVTLQISVGSVVSSATTLSIAPTASAADCVYQGLSTAQLTALDQGGTITTGGFEIVYSAETEAGVGNITASSISGAFTQQTGFELSSGSSSGSVTTTTIGACTVYQVKSSASGTFAGGAATDLDAGTVTLSGPSGSNITNETITETNNTYSLTLGETGITGVPNLPNGVLVAGGYTLAGKGGKDVGSFTTSISLGSPLTITGGLPTTVTESAGLTLNWTGGNASDVVEIIGESGTISGTGLSQVTTSTEFVCTTTAGAGGFTVPSSVLTLLPKVSLTAIANDTASGSLSVTSTTTPVNFAPSLTAGGTVASTLSAFTETGTQAAYQ
jgi:uncharacterized protein (TIGR03437 family)